MNKYQKQATMYIIKRLCILIPFIAIQVAYYLMHISEEYVFVVMMMIGLWEVAFLYICYLIYSTWLNKCDDFESKDKKK
jgi:hypothetical protein